MKLEHLNNIVNYEQFLRKKQQLKLGSISFELKTINISGISVYEYLEMKYTRQDMTNEKESSLEFRLNKLAWKWTFENIISLFIIIFIFYAYFYTNFYLYYFNLILPSPSSSPVNNNLNRFISDNFINTSFNFLSNTNLNLNSYLIKICFQNYPII